VSRRHARLFFVSSATAAAGAILLAVVFALGPTTAPSPRTEEIALVRLETLRPNTVVRLTVKELAGLDALANAERERAHQSLWGPRSRPAGMPVFVVRVGDGVHAFLGVDPRTGCELDDKTGERGATPAAAFVDRCHGTAYDLTGRPTRGPGLWFLDELVLQVRGGVVYAVPHRVTAGGVATPGN
jgi:nitrite reductase/ring-hydroxylating ferredoxin subunit